MALKLVLVLATALVALAGYAALVSYRATIREASSEAAYPPEGQFVTVDGRKVHAVVAGSGPDLVLIHGASGNTRDFTFSFLDRLTDRYRVIVFDRPGMGYTDRAADRYDSAFTSRAESPAEQAALLQAAAAQLGADRPIVLGHSYGAAVAMAWALNHPDNIAALVDVSGATMPWPGSLGLLYQINGSALGGLLVPPQITAFVPEKAIESVVGSIFTPNPAPQGYAHAIGATLSIRRDSLRANSRQVNGLRPFVVEMSARYADLSLPVEIVHGDLDTIVPMAIHSQPLSQLIPGANLTILEGVGHMPHHIAPEAVEAAIDRAAERVNDRAGLR